jgi:hypothetical protein
VDRILVAAAIGASVLATDCGYPFGPCYSEHIEVHQSAMLDRGTMPVEWDGAGVVAPGNIPDFELLRDFLIDCRTIAGREAVWTVHTATGYVAIFLPASVEAGREVSVVAITGGGWGVGETTASGRALISLLDGEFQAAVASGTIEIVATGPLRVRFEVEARDADRNTRILSGEMSFSHSRVRTQCD